MDTRTYARNTTARRLDTLAAEIKRTLDAPDADAVHDLRVSIRRFKQALSVFADWLPAKEARKARRALRKVMDAAGRVRDRDIAREILDRSRAEQAPAMSEAIGPHRDQAARELVAEAGRLWLKNVGVTWREPLGLNAPFVQPMPAEAAPQPEAAPAPAAEKETDRDIGAMARASLPLAAHKYFEAGRRAMDRRRSAKALHQFRIQSKHFRYTPRVVCRALRAQALPDSQVGSKRAEHPGRSERLRRGRRDPRRLGRGSGTGRGDPAPPEEPDPPVPGTLGRDGIAGRRTALGRVFEALRARPQGRLGNGGIHGTMR